MTQQRDREDGGPAFPIQDQRALGGALIMPGMSLRDWFAGQALTGLPERWDGNFTQNEIAQGEPDKYAALIASSAYRIADALLKARGASK